MAARKREAGGRKLGRPWPKNVPRREADNRRRNSNTRIKRDDEQGEYRVSKCIICDYASPFLTFTY